MSAITNLEQAIKENNISVNFRLKQQYKSAVDNIKASLEAMAAEGKKEATTAQGHIIAASNAYFFITSVGILVSDYIALLDGTAPKEAGDSKAYIHIGNALVGADKIMLALYIKAAA